MIPGSKQLSENWTTAQWDVYRRTGQMPPRPKAATVVPAKPEKSRLAVQWESMWEASGGPPYAVEVKVCDDREWRYDYFWPGEPPIALELQGGVYRMGVGGHGAADRMKNDADKSNEAAFQGVRLLKLCTGQVTPERVGMILAFIKKHRTQHL